ncbi:MAG: L-threonylcarbamoyladenylate synthase [Solirubrobacterales bacterium]
MVSTACEGGREARAALCRCVMSGGVALFPADTVYGLACDPLNAQAVKRIAAMKGRDPSQPTAVMYLDQLLMRELLVDLDPRVGQALVRLLPGPITAIIPNAAGRYPLAAGDRAGTLGIRLIDGPLAGAGCVLWQTSANRSGKPEAREVVEVDDKIRAAVDLIVDGGRLPGIASTVVDLTALVRDEPARVLREGAVHRDEARSRLRPPDG